MHGISSFYFKAKCKKGSFVDTVRMWKSRRVVLDIHGFALPHASMPSTATA